VKARDYYVVNREKLAGVIPVYIGVAAFYLIVFTPAVALVLKSPGLLAVHILDTIIVVWSFLYFRRTKNVRRVSYALSVIAYLTVVSVMVTNGVAQSGLFLAFPYIPFIAFMRDPMSARRWMFGMLATMLVLLSLSANGSLHLPYSKATFMLYMINYLIALILIFGYISEKERSDSLIQQQLSELDDVNTELEEALGERSKAVKKLEHQADELGSAQKDVLKVLSDLKTEKTYAQTEAMKNEALIGSIGDGLVVTDEYGHITFINPVAEALLGVTKQQAADRWYQDVIHLYDHDGEPVPGDNRPLYIAISTAKPASTRTLLLGSSDGARIPVAITASPFVINGQPRGAIELISDITAERALDEAKDDFLALVSHQLQTPATAVKQFLGLILEGYVGKVNAEQQNVIKKAYENNEDQINIIQDLLEVARIESGKSVINYESVPIKTLIDEVVGAQHITFEKRRQKLTVSIAKDLTIQADRVKLKMCIANLLSNAIKYTPEKGAITISAKQVGKTCEIAVGDTGLGMTKSQLDKLFIRFARVNQKAAANIPGTGIGLYLCKQIAVMHGGMISVTSKVGKGSTFTLQLPKQPSAKERPAA